MSPGIDCRTGPGAVPVRSGPLRRPYHAPGDLRQIQTAAVTKAALAFGQPQQRFQQASLLVAEVEQQPQDRSHGWGVGISMQEALLQQCVFKGEWRAVNPPHLVAVVRAGARFANGHLVERPDESEGEAQAA